jgi:hypothetical protein
MTRNDRFALLLKMRNGNVVRVSQPNDLPQYVALNATVKFDQEMAAKIAKLTTSQRFEIDNNAATELARMKMEYGVTTELTQIAIQRLVPITPNLTEEVFLSNLQDVNDALIVSASSVSGGLNKIFPVTTMSPTPLWPRPESSQ